MESSEPGMEVTTEEKNGSWKSEEGVTGPQQLAHTGDVPLSPISSQGIGGVL